VSKPKETKDQIIARQAEEIRYLREKNAILEKKINALINKIFGSNSEKLDPAQLELLLNPEDAKKPDAAECEEDAQAAELERELRVVKPPKTREPRVPKNIRKVEEVITPDYVLKNPEQYRKIGEKRTTKLDFTLGFFTERTIVRGVYAKIDDVDSLHTAPLPPCLLDGSVLTPSLLASIVTSKYCDHLPLYRQAQIMQRRYGINIPRNTMSDWMEIGADWLTPIWQALAHNLRQSNYIKVDETPIKYLAPGNGSTKKGKLWVYHNPSLNTMVYDWHTSRATKCLDRILGKNDESFQGILHSDGYSVYDKWAKEHEGVIQAGCWAHVRRKFFDSLKEAPECAAKILRLIQKLYRIEKRIADSPTEVRRHNRKKQSRPITKRLYRLIVQAKRKHLPKSDMGKAASYALGQWHKLIVFRDNEKIDIDNNSCERGVRPTKIGLKNWLFVGGADTGWRSAIFYTMVENCKLHGKDPYAYLEWVFEKLPTMTNQDDIRELLPANWAEKSATKAEEAVA
jgi:transposase